MRDTEQRQAAWGDGTTVPPASARHRRSRGAVAADVTRLRRTSHRDGASTRRSRLSRSAVISMRSTATLCTMTYQRWWGTGTWSARRRGAACSTTISGVRQWRASIVTRAIDPSPLWRFGKPIFFSRLSSSLSDSLSKNYKDIGLTWLVSRRKLQDNSWKALYEKSHHCHAFLYAGYVFSVRQVRHLFCYLRFCYCNVLI